MRLDKLLAASGHGSRSEVKEMVRKGRVRLNGAVVKDSGINVSDTDEVTVDGGRVLTGADAERKVYYMLNKPAGIVSATEDSRDATVIGLFAKEGVKELFTVGRLDKDTEGLLLVTNDGALSHFLLAPSRAVPKTYFARVSGILTEADAEMLARGVEFKDFTSRPARLEICKVNKEENTCEVNITVTEGKFHEVKRLVAAAGCEVSYLKRIAFGPLKLDDRLNSGEYRALSEEELELLKKAATGLKAASKD